MEIKSELLNLGQLDKRLPMKEKLSVSYDKNYSVSDLGIDIDRRVNEMLAIEISKGIQDKILKEMSSFNEQFLDVMNLSESDSVNILYNYLHTNKFEFIIVSSQIGMFIQDSILFTSNGKPHQLINGTLYHFGRLGNIDCHIDSYKKWNDKEIICGKKHSFIYNYELSNIKEINDPFTKVQIDLSYDAVFNKTSFLNLHFVNEYNPKYVQVNRDRKIDEII